MGDDWPEQDVGKTRERADRRTQVPWRCPSQGLDAGSLPSRFSGLLFLSVSRMHSFSLSCSRSLLTSDVGSVETAVAPELSGGHRQVRGSSEAPPPPLSCRLLCLPLPIPHPGKAILRPRPGVSSVLAPCPYDPLMPSACCGSSPSALDPLESKGSCL